MGNRKQTMAQAVWQRVGAVPEFRPEPGELHGLAMAAAEAAGIYRALVGCLNGRRKEEARSLWERQQETIACLRGMQMLSFGRGEAPKLPELTNPNPRRLLEKAYHQARSAQVEYTARTIHQEFGGAFRVLAQREEENCVRILRLLGEG